jgi:hypothetical protein
MLDRFWEITVQMNKDMTLATWNVLSLYRPGALAKLKDELNKYRVAPAAVKKIRWRGCEISDFGDFVVC